MEIRLGFFTQQRLARTMEASKNQQAASLCLSDAACCVGVLRINQPDADGKRRGMLNGFAASVNVLPWTQVCMQRRRKCYLKFCEYSFATEKFSVIEFLAVNS
ncbi:MULTISPECIES: hypothetical protein [Comamonas]|uniref:hypothetical protein n=1 Tax=Comamonas TaxID=283 RepID=UPI0012C10974|nr:MULTISPECIES: hypothetical protein [Comamonas]MEB5967094.1 hypothetical protein [Comamonas testosteroni]MPS92578.1 hypothetical protein [Comamonas sp.]